MGELIVNGIKIGLVVSAGLAFMVALNALIQLVGTLVFGSVIGEVFGIMSMCLPFDLAAVMSAIGLTCAAILSYLIAAKIWALVIVSEDAV